MICKILDQNDVIETTKITTLRCLRNVYSYNGMAFWCSHAAKQKKKTGYRGGAAWIKLL